MKRSISTVAPAQPPDPLSRGSTFFSPWIGGRGVERRATTSLTRRAALGLTLAVLGPILTGCTVPFTSMGRGVFVVSATGQGLHRVANGSPWLAWSADSQLLALRYPDGEVLVASADGFGVRPYGGGSFVGRGWSPDGLRIAVADAAQNEIRIETGDGTVLNRAPLREEMPSLWELATVEDNVPVWSPDGSRIAFLAWDGNGDALYTMDPGGGNRRKLTDIPISQNQASRYPWLGQLVATGDAGSPVWSPDGQFLAYAVYPEVRGGEPGIVIEPAGGGEGIQVTDQYPVSGPVWSPDGQRIAYTARQEHFIVLYVARIDGTPPRPLTSQLGMNARYPAWAPDGLRIAFAGGADLFVTDLAGNNQRLASTGLVTRDPVWSPDGTRIAFLGVPAQPGR